MHKMNKKLPFICPSCTAALQVQSLSCPGCDTVVSGHFPLPVLSQLGEEEQLFILDFVKSSGSLKLMAEKLKLSYPSVRNRLDDIITHLNSLQNPVTKS